MARTDTREEIVRIGGELIARGGFSATGIDQVLKKAQVPKGSFYYYFSSKEEFGIAVIERFAGWMMDSMRACTRDESMPPLNRIRAYFEKTMGQIGSVECKRGCLLGDLGQELAHQNETFRKHIAGAFQSWKDEMVACLRAAVVAKQLPKTAKVEELADFMLTGWEGAILRAKVAGDVKPLAQFVEVLFDKVLVK
jgi:TetR/AcrR family transcriptional regulator, transcriptional repressor for nem operon